MLILASIKCPFVAGYPSQIRLARTAIMPLCSKFDNTWYLNSIKSKNTIDSTMVVDTKWVFIGYIKQGICSNRMLVSICLSWLSEESREIVLPTLIQAEGREVPLLRCDLGYWGWTGLRLVDEMRKLHNAALFKKSWIVVEIIWQTKIFFNPKISCYSNICLHGTKYRSLLAISLSI